MIATNPVDLLKAEYDSLSTYLADKREISLLSDLNKNFRKILLLSCSSYFEHQVIRTLSDFVKQKSGGDYRIINFLEKQAISQKYHTLFDWGKQNRLDDFEKKGANKFWKLFGDEFKNKIEEELKGNNNETELEKNNRLAKISAIEAFIEIGHHRNILVHNNFADYDYNQKTAEEIFNLFKTAEPFIPFLSEKLN
jgi:hypothetical protein